MNKLKLLWEKILENFKDIFSKFPITMSIVMLVTVISAVCLDDFIIKGDTLENIVFIGSIWAVGTLFSETYFKEKKIGKYISFVITLLIAIFFNFYLKEAKVLLDWSKEKTETIVANIFATYMISLLLLIIYRLSKKSDLDIKEYLLNVFSESFIVGITYSILNIGLAAVSVIFISLILDGESFEFILRMLILSLGFYYIPSMISVLANTEKIKVSSFVEKLLLFVIFPLTMVAIFIIYLYLAKILILRDIPKNVIGRILIAVYLVAIPVWAMVISTKKDNFIKVAKIIPYIYLPLIILEIYSVVVRILEYGFTASRYLFILFIIFQFISFYIIIVKKEKYLRELILVVIAFAVVFLISPINYRVVSNLSQKAILDQYVKNGIGFDNCSKEEKKQYRGAYKYLIKQYDGQNYINSNISEEDKVKLGSYFYEEYNDDNYVRETESVYYHESLKELDVLGYSKIYYFNKPYGYKENINTRNIKIEYGEKQQYIDLEEFLKNIINYNEKYNEYDSYIDLNRIISIETFKVIYITDINFSYNKDYELEDLSIEGFLLEK